MVIFNDSLFIATIVPSHLQTYCVKIFVKEYQSTLCKVPQSSLDYKAHGMFLFNLQQIFILFYREISNSYTFVLLLQSFVGKIKEGRDRLLQLGDLV